uniref:Uncharacterized protein n=1 Tax=Arundo donax TaxID=35708 RepID=A0A0A9F9V1_ARUDO
MCHSLLLIASGPPVIQLMELLQSSKQLVPDSSTLLCATENLRQENCQFFHITTHFLKASLTC